MKQTKAEFKKMVKRLIAEHKDKLPSYRSAEKELPQLLAENKVALPFFRFLASRQRSSDFMDVAQTLSYMRKMFAEPIDTVEYRKVLHQLVGLNFCSMGNPEGREKVYWHHWIFPIFSEDNRTLLGLKIERIGLLKENRNLFGNHAGMTERYRHQLLLPKDKRVFSPEVVFEAKSMPVIKTTGDLSQFSTNELLEEIKRRMNNQ